MHIQWKNIYVVSQSLFEASDGVYQLSQASVVSMLVFYAMIIFFICGIILYKLNQYKKSTYFKITHNSYCKVYFDKGKLGEYLIYKRLKSFEENGAKFLFNVYLPKEDGSTTEIDVLMICLKGIFVFESKNYSGWIFGSEEQRNWTQTLPKGRGRSQKQQFFNPIIQNKGHIKHLRNFVGENVIMKSLIVFSERCTLKNVTIKNRDIKVANRDRIVLIVSEMYNQMQAGELSEDDINRIYEKLYPFTQLESELKERHIHNIQQKKKSTIEEPTMMEEETEQNLQKEAIVIEEENCFAKENVEEKNEEINICPKCKGQLILRTARTGKRAGSQFWGCSNYPKCRYIRNIDME